MTVHINSVKIRAVMGIPNVLTLDLSAPLTLIYAPNGTGKTSSWTAVKSLMSASVSGDIQCRVSNGLAAEVAADLSIGGKSFAALAKDGQLQLRSGNGEILSNTDALRALASEIDTTGVQTRGGVLKERLATQIVSSRFLPSDSLLYLIDNDESSTELRRKLFADLTGTSVIQSEIRETRQYRAKIASELVTIERELVQVSAQSDALSIEHNSFSSDPLQLIGNAASLARLDLPAQMAPNEAISALRDFQLGELERLEQARAADLACHSIATAYPTLSQDLSAASLELSAATTARDLAQVALNQVQGELARDDFQRARIQLVSAQRLQAKVAEILSTDGRAKIDASRSLQHIRASVTGFSSEYELEARLNDLVRLSQQRVAYQTLLDEHSRLLDISANLATTQDEPSIQVEHRLRQRQADLAVLRDRISGFEGLSASIRASAKTLVASSQIGTCPCCSHDWTSPEALLAAIDGSEWMSSKGAALATEIENLQAAVSEEYVRHRRALSHEEQSRACASSLSDVNQKISAIESLSARLGVVPRELLNQGQELEELERVRALLGAWRLLEVLDEAALSSDDLVSVQSVVSTLADEVDRRRALVAEAERATQERKLRVDRHREELEAGSAIVNVCAERVATLTRVRRELEVANEILSSLGYVRDEAAGALRAKASMLDRLGNLVTQASAAVEASLAIAGRAKIELNQKKLQARGALLQREVEVADRLVEMLKSSEARASQRFFEQLAPAVGTLFDHMQVNRVFQNLSIRAVAESFCLDGLLGNEVALNPGDHFSQGQRQDLALSMFLVRAASLGGSFFLDEPLSHLDDLNRTALLDCLRACVIGTLDSSRPVRLVVTTANWSVARHLMQKFYSIRHPVHGAVLRVIQLSGNVSGRVEQSEVFPGTSSVASEQPIH